MSDARQRALVHALTERGTRAFTADDYSRQGMLDAVRELRRRERNDPRVRFLGDLARGLAHDIASVVDLPPADIASVLLAAGGSVGLTAELHGLSAQSAAAIFQYTADELDQFATGGGQR